MITPRLSATEIARILNQPEPTNEQKVVIEAPLSPMLVVAGAGSGKTATMAAKVVYLVANGLLGPGQILGLTFARKAAAELSDRIRSQLRAIAEVESSIDLSEWPRIATYNAYAAAIVRDHGLRLGIDPDATLLSEAGRYQLAERIVTSWPGDITGNSATSTLVGAVLSLAGELSEHGLATRDVTAYLERLRSELESKGPAPRAKQPLAEVREFIAQVGTRMDLLEIVTDFTAAKRERGFLDFGDQVRIAADLAAVVPAVGAGEREQYRVVLLDEYQDTSIAQVQLLSSLFGASAGTGDAGVGHPVTAVGDPNQAIYGWRGAAAGTLLEFTVQFPAEDGASPVATLSTAWRNSQDILTVANKISAPLRGESVAGSGGPEDSLAPEPGDTTDVAPLVPELRPRPGAPAGRVRVAYGETLAAEHEQIIEFLREQGWGTGGTTTATPPTTLTPPTTVAPPTTAVLFRKRAFFTGLADALTAAKIPFQIAGLAGLLETPEVADLWAGLRAAHDPTRGDALMRLLTGPRLGIGTLDLWVMSEWARELTRRASIEAVDTGAAAGVDARPNADESPGAEAPRKVATTPSAQAPEDAELASIVEALDRLPAPGWSPRGSQRPLSPAARERLTALSTQLRAIRSLVHLPVPELVTATEHILGLDIEVLAYSTGPVSQARRNLDDFLAAAANFISGVDEANLAGFLTWLEAAHAQEKGLATAELEPDPTAVQIMTIHGAKGLEWDAVVVGGMNESDFPSDAPDKDGERLSSGWLTGVSSLPYELRGDAANLPSFDHEQAETHSDMKDVWREFRLAEGARELREERRLAYVAITRAKSDLLLSGSFWTTRTKVNTPSLFLGEAVRTGILDGAIPPGSTHETLPTAGEETTGLWPATSNGAPWRRVLARAVATRVDPSGGEDTVLADWFTQADLLLAERDATSVAAPVTPGHLSASRVVAAARNPEAFEVGLRRPIPTEPSNRARQGTRFHSWVEQHFAAATLVDLDWLPGADDDTAGEEDLSALTAAFLDSAWSAREPDSLEVDVETTVGQLRVRSRIDAVFTDPDGAYHIVDWKTGAPPRGREEDATRQIQLQLYRLAWARAKQIPIGEVRASFHYVSDDLTVAAPDLSETEVENLLSQRLHAANIATVAGPA